MRLYLWWSLCTLYLHTSQVSVIIGLSLSIKVFEFEFPCVLILIKDLKKNLPQSCLDIFSRCKKTENDEKICASDASSCHLYSEWSVLFVLFSVRML